MPTVELPSSTPLLPAHTPSLLPATPTPQPLAALVNGEAISLAEYQAELSRYMAAVGTELATEDEQRVLNDLIDRVILAQAAVEVGFVVNETILQERYDGLVTRLGNEQALLDWMTARGYSKSSFRQDLARSIAAAWMREQILSEMPGTVEQVHVRQILLYNSDEANEVLAQLGSGEDFVTLSAQYDPVAKGDLGWFPRGYLLDPKLEDVAFSLHPGEYSEVVETSIGFHILYVIENDPQHPLSPDARLVLQLQALRNWLDTRHKQSDIQVLLP